jgi:putative membrane protein
MSKLKDKNKPDKIQIILLVLSIIFLIISLISPKNYLIWLLEALPVLIGILILIFTRKRFQFTNFVYILIFLEITFILIGAHYTYGEVPLFNWIKETYGLKRNHYDRVGHFFQGVISAFIIREILLRKFKLRKEILLGISVVSACLSLSALYELIEWGVALLGGGVEHDFLGAQGDKWDSHWDMFLVLVGSIITVTVLRKIHDRQIEKMKN